MKIGPATVLTAHIPISENLTKVTSDPDWQKNKKEDPLHYHGGAKAQQGHLTIKVLDRLIALRDKRKTKTSIVYLPTIMGAPRPSRGI